MDDDQISISSCASFRTHKSSNSQKSDTSYISINEEYTREELDNMFMAPACIMCDNDSCSQKKCGHLCRECGQNYTQEYMQYKMQEDPTKQRRLRKKFSDKWFGGKMDADHAWAMKMLEFDGQRVFDGERMVLPWFHDPRYKHLDTCGKYSDVAAYFISPGVQQACWPTAPGSRPLNVPGNVY